MVRGDLFFDLQQRRKDLLEIEQTVEKDLSCLSPGEVGLSPESLGRGAREGRGGPGDEMSWEEGVRVTKW